MVLSDKQIKEGLQSGSIVIEPLGEACIQPSSVDLHVDRLFRVFRNDTTPYIDPKRAQEDLTELVEVGDDSAFILHPGEFVLGSTLERVALGPDLVARLEGKSSLGRLGLLIHSSLPASEEIMILRGDKLAPMPIGEVVDQQLDASVVSFDPDTFEVGFHRITGWYEGPPDRIYEVELESGRSVRVTAGHNFFTLDEAGRLKKARTAELAGGARVAIPVRTPQPGHIGQATLSSAELERGSDTTATLAPPRPIGLASRDDLAWEPVTAVRDTGSVEPIYDIEVRPGGRKIENFLAGKGGVFVSNTAGFVDAGWDGHLTLELSNVANLPIAIYPGMKIGQISFLQMTSEAEVPYGSDATGSKYKGQQGPTPSRYYLNFPENERKS
ncbi:hypothetical protein BH24ACT23_BH24ACT23_04080 [soil metagenome]